MRDECDLVSVQVGLVHKLQLDLEQLENNSRFRSILETLQAEYPELTHPQLLRLAVLEYLSHYINSHDFPYQTPGTTGPGNVFTTDIEVTVHDRNESQAGNQPAA